MPLMYSWLLFRSFGERNWWMGKELPSAGESGGERKPLDKGLSVSESLPWKYSRSDPVVDVSDTVEKVRTRSVEGPWCLVDNVGSSTFNDLM